MISVVPSLGGARIEQVARKRLKRFGGGSVQDLVLVIAPREGNALLAVRDTGNVARATGTTPVEVQVALAHASAAAKRHLRGGGDPGDAARAAIRDFSGSSGSDGGDEVGGWGDVAKGLSLVLLPVLPIVALIALFRGFGARRRLKSFGDGPEPVRDLREGMATVAGTAVTDDPLGSPVKRRPCVAWELSVSEEWRRKRIEQRQDPSLGWVTDEIEEDGTTDLGKTSRSTRFWVRDETGDVLVMPDYAELQTKQSWRGTVGRKDPPRLQPDRRAGGERLARHTAPRGGHRPGEQTRDSRRPG